MIELTTLSACKPHDEVFSLFRQDASIPDEHRDAVLRMHLKSAMIAIQEVANRSLLKSVLRLTVSEREDNAPVRLYQSPETILSVTDGHGNAIGYTMQGLWLTPDRYTPTVIVSYETAVDEGALDALASAVSRYAVALYDHEDISVLNAIKASCV